MSPLKYIRARSGSRDGIALVMVLAFIVLLTILIVSFIAFTRLNRMSTASYSKSIQAQEVAEGGMQDILGDLHAEIIAGSTNNAAVYVVGTNSYARVYIPSTNYTASPAHLGYDPTAWGTDINTPNDSLSPTLIRVSRASQDGTATDFFPPLTNAYYDSTQVKNLLNRASKANTSTPSVNGRYISAARWNKTFFLACTSDTNENDSYYMPGVFVSTNYPVDYAGTPDGASSINAPWGPPDWVYVTRAGSRVCTNSAAELPLLLPSNNLTTSYAVTAGQNPPASPVVGRYAYVMYDEGAMLDSSVAGFYSTPQTYTSTNVIASVTPTTVYPNTTQTVMGKSYLPYADLSLPPLLGTQANVNAFVAFRNGSLGTPSNSTYLNAAFNYGLKGFLSFQAGDSPMLGRQDLINYFAKADSGFNTGSVGISRALPYFGTFSRAVSAPSYCPPADATTLGAASNGTGNIYAYHANAEVSTASPFSSTKPNPNRDLANVRFVNAGTITHYTDDATATALTYNVNAGDPLLASRFSLAKIDWLSRADPVAGTAPSSTYATAIQSCFGLTWGTQGSANGGNACWSYVGSPAGPSGTLASFNGTIETLDQVAKEGREPNFFELLKAAILNGSLGQNPGKAVFNNGNDLSTLYNIHGGGANTGVDGLYAFSYQKSGTPVNSYQITDMQVMQIGANIIDQFDADSYPTAIYFKYNGVTFDAASGNLSFGNEDMVYGDENLPLLMGMFLPSATVDGLPAPAPAPGTYGTTAGLSVWWQPEIWNPHQMPNPANNGTAPPSTFMIQGYGQVSFEWSTRDASSHGIGGGSAAQTLDGNQTISFTDGSPTTSWFYSAPQLLVQVDSAAPTSTLTSVTPSMSQMAANSSMEGWSGNFNNGSGNQTVVKNHFVGFWSGYDPTYTGSDTFVNVTSSGTGTALSYCMGWTSGSGATAKFHPYSFLPGMFAYTYAVVNNTSGIEGGGSMAGFTDPGQISAQWHALIDPRTERFSSQMEWMSGWNFPTNATTFFPDMKHHSGGTGTGTPDIQPLTPSFVYDLTPTKTYPNIDGYNEVDWEVNSPTPLAQTGNPNPPTDKTYYKDPDGVVRPGDSVFGIWSTGDGMQLFDTAGTDASTPTGVAAVGDTASTGNGTGNTQHGRRPVILNRPFHNVGELGYTFRDLPFKTLDFFSTLSADAALLDVFSTTDEAQVSSSNQISAIVAGRINPSNAPVPVLEAILSYGAEKDSDPTYNMLISGANSNAKLVAQKIAGQLSPATGTGPISSRAGLVTQLGANLTAAGETGAILNGFPAATAWNKANKAYLEGPVRALSNVTNARTWNLMVDIIAQSGHLSPTAKTLDDFVVEGEKRYWLHIAIDRYTGKIVDQQLEPVYE